MLKIIPHINNIKEFTNIGDKIKFKFSLEIIPRRATAPAGGWRQRDYCPKAIAIATAIPKEKELLPKKPNEKQQILHRINLLLSNFLVELKNFLPRQRQVLLSHQRELLIMIDDLSLLMHTTAKKFIERNAPTNDIKIFLYLIAGWKDLIIFNCFSKLKKSALFIAYY